MNNLVESEENLVGFKTKGVNMHVMSNSPSKSKTLPCVSYSYLLSSCSEKEVQIIEGIRHRKEKKGRTNSVFFFFFFKAFID